MRRRISQQTKASRVAEHHYYNHDDNGSPRPIGTEERGYQPPPCSGCERKAEVHIINRQVSNPYSTKPKHIMVPLIAGKNRAPDGDIAKPKMMWLLPSVWLDRPLSDHELFA
jgi:hypothetical protein